MSERIVKNRKIITRLIPEAKLAQEGGRGITKATGLEEPFQSNVDIRKDTKAAEQRQGELIKQAKQAEELRLAEEKSEVARRKPVTGRSRRTLLGG